MSYEFMETVNTHLMEEEARREALLEQELHARERKAAFCLGVCLFGIFSFIAMLL